MVVFPGENKLGAALKVGSGRIRSSQDAAQNTREHNHHLNTFRNCERGVILGSSPSYRMLLCSAKPRFMREAVVGTRPSNWPPWRNSNTNRGSPAETMLSRVEHNLVWLNFFGAEHKLYFAIGRGVHSDMQRQHHLRKTA